MFGIANYYATFLPPSPPPPHPVILSIVYSHVRSTMYANFNLHSFHSSRSIRTNGRDQETNVGAGGSSRKVEGVLIVKQYDCYPSVHPFNHSLLWHPRNIILSPRRAEILFPRQLQLNPFVCRLFSPSASPFTGKCTINCPRHSLYHVCGWTRCESRVMCRKYLNSGPDSNAPNILIHPRRERSRKRINMNISSAVAVAAATAAADDQNENIWWCRTLIKAE